MKKRNNKRKILKIIDLILLLLTIISIIQLFTIKGTATTPNGYEYTYRGGLVKVCTGSEKAFLDMGV